MKPIIAFFVVIIVFGLVGGCDSSGGSGDVDYVALGASDTTGVGVTPITNGYVYLIQDGLENKGQETRLLNLGIPSAEIDEIRELELGLATERNPDLITLTAGPNDIVGGTTVESFEIELTEVFEGLRGKTNSFVVVATIPDLTLLPRFVDEPNANVTKQRVDAYNDAIIRQASAFQVPVADLRPFDVGGDVTASDGFHPNDEGYRIMAREFLKIIEPQFVVASDN